MGGVSQPVDTSVDGTPVEGTAKATPGPLPGSIGRARLRSAWAATRAGLGSLLGLVPHVMHHIGIVAGTALLAGFWGNAALYVLGLVLSIPMFKRLHRRYGSIAAPILGISIFTALFLFSTLVLGPAINGVGSAPTAPAPSSSSAVESGHATHHS